MRVLLDQGTPVPLRQYLSPHEVVTAYEQGWSKLKNGELLAVAEKENFAVLLKTDRKLKYHQNLSGRRNAEVILGTPSWPRLLKAVDKIVRAIDSAIRGNYSEVEIP